MNDAEPDQDRQWAHAADCVVKGDYSGALFLFKRLANDGYWQAYVEIGNLYELGGKGIERDAEQAASWYRRAIYSSDDPNAHLGLARLIFNGEVPDSTDETFLRHSQKAVAAGLPYAHLLLGSALHSGKSVGQDIEKAKEHYQKAAEAGLVLGAWYMGKLDMAQGRVFRGLFLCVKTFFRAVRIAAKDHTDSRLSGIG